MCCMNKDSSICPLRTLVEGKHLPSHRDVSTAVLKVLTLYQHFLRGSCLPLLGCRMRPVLGLVFRVPPFSMFLSSLLWHLPPHHCCFSTPAIVFFILKNTVLVVLVHSGPKAVSIPSPFVSHTCLDRIPECVCLSERRVGDHSCCLLTRIHPHLLTASCRYLGTGSLTAPQVHVSCDHH